MTISFGWMITRYEAKGRFLDSMLTLLTSTLSQILTVSIFAGFSPLHLLCCRASPKAKAARKEIRGKASSKKGQQVPSRGASCSPHPHNHFADKAGLTCRDCRPLGLKNLFAA